MNIPPTQPIPSPTTKTAYGATQVASGTPIAPIRLLRVMESREWEEFVAEWVDSLRQTQIYQEVHRCGGGGDFGRDVVAYRGAVGSNCPWDNYQCKHYNRPLAVADVIPEIGKLIYYVSENAFTAPEKYVFVSPQGPSTALLKCIEKSTVRSELIQRWDAECKAKITSTKLIDLKPALRDAIDAFDFSIIEIYSPLKVLEGHRNTPYYVGRFGGGLPNRILPPPPPRSIQPEESVYIASLLDAYGDEKGLSIPDISTLASVCSIMARHLQRSREHFFYAESLRAFSRDTLPQGTFESLQNEVFDGVQDTYEDSHTSGYRRVKETVKAARELQLTGNALTGVLHSNDRAGMCHQLANEGRFIWVVKENA